jgi:hypothetical protein
MTGTGAGSMGTAVPGRPGILGSGASSSSVAGGQAAPGSGGSWAMMLASAAMQPNYLQQLLRRQEGHKSSNSCNSLSFTHRTDSRPREIARASKDRVRCSGPREVRTRGCWPGEARRLGGRSSPSAADGCGLERPR